MTSPDNATQPSFFKTLIRGSLKISSVIVLSAIGLSISGFVLYKGYLQIGEQANSDLVKLRTYEVDRKEHLGVTIRVKTKYLDGSAIYKLRVVGFPSYMNDPGNREKGFYLMLEDADKFTVTQKFLPLNEGRKLVGQSAESADDGFEFQGQIYLDPSDYRRVVNVSIGWNLLTDESKSK